LNPPQPPLLEEDLLSVRHRLELISWNWQMLNALRKGIYERDLPIEGLRPEELVSPPIVVSDKILFPGDGKVSPDFHRILILNAMYILLSEIENICQAFARILIRQIGKNIRRSHNWSTLSKAIGDNGFLFEDNCLIRVKRWKEVCSDIRDHMVKLGVLSEIRGTIHHGAIDKIIHPQFLINRLAPNQDKAEDLISCEGYINEVLGDLQEFTGKFVGWIEVNEFLPQLPVGS
jgi:hypothetical protein